MDYENKSGKVIDVDIEREMRESYLAYSMSVIVSRALPDVRDGLKPVHRRILYTMYENNLSPDRAYRKCADTVGTVLGRYHPHGDASVYDALVRLAQDFSLRYPLVDGHGNFGSIDGDPPAAYRYTEARMSKMCTVMLDDIEKETVDYMPNYDDRLKEPVVLPSRFPNLLCNGSQGIAVGMATNVPPHNLREVIGAVDCLLDNPNAGLDELMQHIQGPDFPTGGIIMGRSGIRSAYGTGRGKIIVRAKTEIVEHKNGHFAIIVTELPYMVNKARLIESIADLVKEKKIEGITALRDESDRDGMRIVIELRRDAIPQFVLNQLFSFSQMQETFGAIMLCLVNNVPRELTLKEMLENYISFQEEVIRRRTDFDLKKARERAHILEGLKIALDFIDRVIEILRSSKTIPEGKERLMNELNIDDIQASAIVAMRLGQLTGLEREKIEEELTGIRAKIEEYLLILSDEGEVKRIIRAELDEIGKKYGDERRTAIETVDGEVDVEDLIPREDCVFTLTRFGYMKRQPVDLYRTQNRGGRGVSGMTQKEEDFTEEMFVGSSHEYVCLFTNLGKMYRIKGYEIPSCSRASKGTNVVNVLPLEPEEKVTAMIRVPQDAEHEYLCMVTKQGVIKRCEMSEFERVNRTGKLAIDLDEGDELSWVRLTSGNDDLLVATAQGMAVCFPEEKVRCMGRAARGVKAIELAEGDEVVGLVRIDPDGYILTVTEQGKGYLCEHTDYPRHNRGGKGTLNYRVNEESGRVIAVLSVRMEDELMAVADDGVMIRVPVRGIRVCKRPASGVWVMRPTAGAKVSTIALAELSEAAEDAGEESGPEDGDTD